MLLRRGDRWLSRLILGYFRCPRIEGCLGSRRVEWLCRRSMQTSMTSRKEIPVISFKSSSIGGYESA